jgi:hypothetical protein
MRIVPPRSAMNSRELSPGACVTKIGELRPVATDCMPVITAYARFENSRASNTEKVARAQD